MENAHLTFQELQKPLASTTFKLLPTYVPTIFLNRLLTQGSWEWEATMLIRPESPVPYGLLFRIATTSTLTQLLLALCCTRTSLLLIRKYPESTPLYSPRRIVVSMERTC